MCVETYIGGECDARLVNTKAAFERNFHTMLETNTASVAVMLKGQMMLSLHGGRVGNGGKRVDASDSLQVAFSTSKVVSSLACAMLVDRSLIAYNATIAQYWPEFGKFGKENVTIRKYSNTFKMGLIIDIQLTGDLMQHSAGLAWLSDESEDIVSMALWNTSIIDPHDDHARMFESSRLRYPADHHNTKTAYHGVTRDMILSGYCYS
jgi:CubicO group peptidase (beta-lactamase class C family)